MGLPVSQVSKRAPLAEQRVGGSMSWFAHGSLPVAAGSRTTKSALWLFKVAMENDHFS